MHQLKLGCLKGIEESVPYNKRVLLILCTRLSTDDKVSEYISMDTAPEYPLIQRKCFKDPAFALLEVLIIPLVLSVSRANTTLSSNEAAEKEVKYNLCIPQEKL